MISPFQALAHNGAVTSLPFRCRLLIGVANLPDACSPPALRASETAASVTLVRQDRFGSIASKDRQTRLFRNSVRARVGDSQFVCSDREEVVPDQSSRWRCTDDKKEIAASSVKPVSTVRRDGFVCGGGGGAGPGHGSGSREMNLGGSTPARSCSGVRGRSSPNGAEGSQWMIERSIFAGKGKFRLPPGSSISTSGYVNKPSVGSPEAQSSSRMSPISNPGTLCGHGSYTKTNEVPM